MLEETSKRQNTFYRSFESCYGYLELLMPIFQSCDIIDKIEHSKTQVKKILSDTAPKDVMAKASIFLNVLYHCEKNHCEIIYINSS